MPTSHGSERVRQLGGQDTQLSADDSWGIRQLFTDLWSLSPEESNDPSEKSPSDGELVARMEADMKLAQQVQEETEETLKAERKAFEEERKAWQRERARLEGSLDVVLEVLASRLPPTASPGGAARLARLNQTLSSVNEQDVAESSELSISTDSDPSKNWCSDESVEKRNCEGAAGSA